MRKRTDDDPELDGPIYLDYNATTPVDPSVRDAMAPFLRNHFGNASSAHPYGRTARTAVETARAQVASLIGATSSEIVFTGGGSEADNLAIKGVALHRYPQKTHIVTVSTEHAAVLNTLRYLNERFGIETTIVPVDSHAMVDADALKAAIRPATNLITVMHANNEVGTIQPIETIAGIAREAGVLLHVDAAQSAGKIPVSVDALGVDLVTVAAHKLYGPKGVGALYVRRGVRLDPLIHGAGQEDGVRAGTENVAGIIGMGKACEVARSHLPREQHRLRECRDEFYRLLCAGIPQLLLNGHPTHRLPNTLNVSFPHAVGLDVLNATPKVAASAGAACHSGTPEPSSILLAMGMSVERAIGAVRFSLGRWTTDENIRAASVLLCEGYRRVRG